MVGVAKGPNFPADCTETFPLCICGPHDQSVREDDSHASTAEAGSRRKV